MWAIINERTWKMRIRECVRLAAKTMVAYAPYHVPVVVLIGCTFGLIMFPFKMAKREVVKV
jgi:hypothetical protein